MENTDITNESFAEFLGATYDNDDNRFYFWTIMFKEGKNYFYSHELKFHNDCNWLNAVIHEIKKKSLSGFMGSEINRARIEIFKNVNIFSEEKEVYNACAKFVQWYKLNPNNR